jgi:hypothetical protein
MTRGEVSDLRDIPINPRDGNGRVQEEKSRMRNLSPISAPLL